MASNASVNTPPHLHAVSVSYIYNTPVQLCMPPEVHCDSATMAASEDKQKSDDEWVEDDGESPMPDHGERHKLSDKKAEKQRAYWETKLGEVQLELMRLEPTPIAVGRLSVDTKTGIYTENSSKEQAKPADNGDDTKKPATKARTVKQKPLIDDDFSAGVLTALVVFTFFTLAFLYLGTGVARRESALIALDACSQCIADFRDNYLAKPR